MATKNNPGPFDCYGKLTNDEPYFLLRSTDETAPDFVESWAEMYKDRKQNDDEWNARTEQKYNEAIATAKAMREFRTGKLRVTPGARL